MPQNPLIWKLKREYNKKLLEPAEKRARELGRDKVVIPTVEDAQSSWMHKNSCMGLNVVLVLTDIEDK